MVTAMKVRIADDGERTGCEKAAVVTTEWLLGSIGFSGLKANSRGLVSRPTDSAVGAYVWLHARCG
jgi:hypothetical protein